MRTLIASTAVALTLAAPGFAQTQAPMNMNGGFVGAIENQALRASNLMGARLYVSENEVDTVGGLSTDWDDVGEISDIIVGGGGDIDAVLVDIGGFLGIGERTVAVNMDSLQFVSDGPESENFFIVMQGTRETLEAAPEFNSDFTRGRTLATLDVDNEGSGLTTQDGEGTIVAGQTPANLDAGTVVDAPQTPATAVVTEGGTTVTTTADTDTAATDAGTDGTMTGGVAVEGNVADAPNTADDSPVVVGEAATAPATAATEEAATLTGDAAADIAAETEDAAQATGDAVTDAATDVASAPGNAVEATGDAVTGAATDLADATEETVTTTGDAVAGAVVGAAATGGAVMNMPSMTREGYETVDLGALTTEEVTGAAVYDVNDERLGEIGELVMTDDGQLQDAVIDVGGFLGLGEKPVAVPFDSMQVLRGEGDVRVYLDTTKEALEALPAYDN